VKGRRVLVIRAGIGGLTAAIGLRRAGLDDPTLVRQRNERIGHEATGTMPPYAWIYADDVEAAVGGASA
jgi:cation diffusion facilitator CzcD-associated flavoprotein CzcO